MSHCDCDNKFYSCLKDVGNAMSRITGRMYFNWLRPSCFKLVKKKVCAKFSFNFWLFKFVCDKYKVKEVGQEVRAKKF